MSIQGITANLTADNFQIKQDGVYVQSNGKPGMLLVFATWCSHCVRFKPVFQKICKSLNSKTSKFPCLAIESEQLKSSIGAKLSAALKVEGFPTILYFNQNGKIIGNYVGPRDESNVLDNICKMYRYCVSK